MDRDLAPLSQALDGLDPRITWGVAATTDDGRSVATGADTVLPTASVGKLFLLLAVAEAIEAGRLDPAERLAPAPEDVVADSGLWQHLAEPTLSVESAAALVGAVSDNLATNVLLRRVGLDTVADVVRRLGLTHTALHDQVRDARGPGHAPTLSTGTAAELVRLMGLLRRGEALDAGSSRRVVTWLARGADLSMVLAPFGLDPLARCTDRGISAFHKTGTDDGTRVDSGSITGPAGTVDYCVAARWDPAGPDLRDVVLDGHQSVGRALLRVVSNA